MTNKYVNGLAHGLAVGYSFSPHNESKRAASHGSSPTTGKVALVFGNFRSLSQSAINLISLRLHTYINTNGSLLNKLIRLFKKAIVEFVLLFQREIE